MGKNILTPKLAEEIQDDIYYKMSAEKKVRIASHLFMLAKVIKESKMISKNDSRRFTNKSK